jgi:hypothetical protein
MHGQRLAKLIVSSSKQLAIMKENGKAGYSPGFIKLLLTFLLFSFFTTAQTQTISGTVSDENGKKLSGVSVTIKVSSGGTSTEASGQYRINAASSLTLVFSSVGYTTTNVPVANRTVINTVLSTVTQSFDAIVITASGISKQSRGLGYAATNVKADELTVNRTPNV